MARRGRTNVARAEERTENGVEEPAETNGEHSEASAAEPDKKKRSAGRMSKKAEDSDSEEDRGFLENDESKKKRRSAAKKYVEEKSDQDDSSDDEVLQNKKRKSASKKAKEVVEQEDASSAEESEIEEKTNSKKKKSDKGSKADEESAEKKKRKKAGRGKPPKKAKTDAEPTEDDEGEEEAYEVEKVLDQKDIRGVKHYLIRWKGYGADSDTWEPHHTVDCPNLIAQFKKQNKKSKGQGRKASTSKAKDEEEWDENENFEVDKILDVHFCRDGTREFHVVWKGYPSSKSTWEPESNMDCTELITKFMARVEKAKESSEKQLRVNRKHTDRFTVSTRETGRRLSKRQEGKQRVQYHDAE